MSDNKFKNFAVLTLDILDVQVREKKDGSGQYAVAHTNLPMGDSQPAMPVTVVVTNGLTKVLKAGQSLTLVGKLGYSEKDGQGTFKFFPWKFQEADKPRNFALVTLRVGQEPDARYSENGNFWAKVRAALGFGKDAEGNWKPSWWFTVKGFARDGDETIPATLGALGKGDLVTISGRLTYEVYNDKGYTGLIASKVESFEIEEPATDEFEAIDTDDI